jgi:hypothetical protein
MGQAAWLAVAILKSNFQGQAYNCTLVRHDACCEDALCGAPNG